MTTSTIEQNGQATTLTRERLLSHAAARFEWVDDVPGYGRVGLRSQPEVARSRRIGLMFDGQGNLVAGHRERRRVYMIIDQVMSDEKTPMFTEADFDALASLDGPKLDPLIEAITNFNGESEKNVSAGSPDSSES